MQRSAPGTNQDQAWPEWADAFSVRLAARAVEAEARRTLPEETVQEALDAGFFGMLAPVGVGGQGSSFSEFMDVVRRLSRGCASSGWTLSFLALHAWMLCKFGAEAQAAFFRDGKMPLAPAPLAPTGKAVPVEGGFIVSGRWEWATGINHAAWVLVNVLNSETMVPIFCAMPIESVEIDDVWYVSGMAATGSQAVIVRDIFVPEHLTLPAPLMAAGASPGEALHPGSTLGYPLRAGLALVAATPALGAAEAALDYFRERMKTKLQAFSGGARQGEMQTTHMRLGEAMADVSAARLTWEEACRVIERIGPQGSDAPIETQVWLRLAAAQIVRLANSAVNTLAAAAGASASMTSAPLQRQLRDLQVMRGHVMFDWDRTAVLAGKVELGFPTTPADLL
jgi:alkylation response protein AidB-like acyl-CoA dehydrogenase